MNAQSVVILTVLFMQSIFSYSLCRQSIFALVRTWIPNFCLFVYILLR